MENLIHLNGYDGNGNMAMGYKSYLLPEDDNSRDSRFWYVHPSVVNHINKMQQENASLKDKVSRRNMQIKDLKALIDKIKSILHWSVNSEAKLTEISASFARNTEAQQVKEQGRF